MKTIVKNIKDMIYSELTKIGYYTLTTTVTTRQQFDNYNDYYNDYYILNNIIQ